MNNEFWLSEIENKFNIKIRNKQDFCHNRFDDKLPRIFALAASDLNAVMIIQILDRQRVNFSSEEFEKTMESLEHRPVERESTFAFRQDTFSTRSSITSAGKCRFGRTINALQNIVQELSSIDFEEYEYESEQLTSVIAENRFLKQKMGRLLLIQNPSMCLSKCILNGTRRGRNI
jgi:hypothetical protein